MNGMRPGIGINSAGHLSIGGCDAVELAKAFGTPLYVLDEGAVRARCRAYKEGFDAFPNTEVIYAGKALLTQAVVRIIQSEGLSLDVVSGGELYTALQAGFPAERIYFHGNNKSDDELLQGLEAGIGRFVVDNLFELERLGAFAAARNVRAAIYLRVTPGIEAHTHDYIKTGQIDSKFGFPLGDALDTAVACALANPALDLAGFHCHIGSQIHELTPFADAAQIMAAQIARVKARHGHILRELDLGGGLGIRYTGEDDPKAPGELARQVVAALERASRE
ncbi:MAG TPA: diaminopimelate decarboxylase, partial [Limnochordia bacterium]|nr:diaminopimelate decarboxylase [Limnochordia bacterium]